MNKNVALGHLRRVSENEARILLALCIGPLNSYELGRICMEDASLGAPISNGTLFPAIKRLEQIGAISRAELSSTGKGRARGEYKLNEAGRVMLEWQLSVYRRMVRLGEQRL